MMEHMKRLITVRGSGGIATGTIHKFYRCRYPVLVLESGYPSAIHRYVAFSETIYDGTFEVEEITCIKASGYDEACIIVEQEAVPVMIDGSHGALKKVRPWALVDAILTEKNLSITGDTADKTAGLGSGFMAEQDVDLVVKIMGGYNLERITGNGSAVPNTEAPGVIGGYRVERIIHSPAKGIFLGKALIGDMMEQGQAIGVIVIRQGEVTVEVSPTGLLRGIIKDGYPVMKGFKIANMDPRKNEYENRFTASDKARCIAGSVAEDLQILEAKQGH